MQDVGEPARGRRPAAGRGARSSAAASTATTRRGAERRELVGVVVGLRVRALGVVAARHHDDDLGPRRGDLLPRALLGVLARQAEQVDAAGVLDQLRHPVAGDEDRVEPLERGDAHRRARRARRAARGRSARPRPATRSTPASLASVGLRRACARRRAPRRACAGRARSPAGAGSMPLGDRRARRRTETAQTAHSACVTIRSGCRRAQRALVELVDRRGPAAVQLAHRAVDLVRRRGPGPITSRVTLGSSRASAGSRTRA